MTERNYSYYEDMEDGRTTERVKFTQITRTIDPKTRIHYLDALDESGIHWMAQMDHKTEPHLCYTKVWYQDPQQPKTYKDT